MQIICVKHDDFELIIECNDLESTFAKAQKKQSDIFTATNYLINEGEISIHDFKSKKLERLLSESTYPLLFENKDYFVGISFVEKYFKEKPYIKSKIKEVEEKFFYREKMGFLAGTINFGNELGRSSLTICYHKGDQLKEIIFQFEVFPTKLDYKSDYLKIVKDIEEEYPNLVLDFLKKTYSSFKSGYTPNTDLIWWQVFGGLYKEFIKSAKFILNKPHSRIVKQKRYVIADKILKWTSSLEEEFALYKDFPNRNYRYDYKTLTTNTVENKFFKHAVIKTTKRFINVKNYIVNRYENKISKSFNDELNFIQKELKTLAANPFFKQIDDFQGLKQESLVLQKATGYSTIYKSWIMLNSGLSFLDGIQKIELKNIAELYQIWCFLEVKRIIQKLLGKDNPDDVKIAEIQIDDFVFKIERGVKSKVSFIKSNGDVIDLYHDFSYDSSLNKQVKSFTVNQRPDIVLKLTKNDLKENYDLTYLFDAKYRLASDEKEGSPDLPTEDSINQMHRYRDAIYYVNQEKAKPEKEVIGAYILFPGSGELDTIKNLDYFKSIETVNIGAFPLRPNDSYETKRLLEEHISSIIGSDTETILNEVSPHKLTTYEKHNPEVLIGIVKKGAQSDYFQKGKELIYHSGRVKPSKLKDEDNGYVKIKSDIKFFAPYFAGIGVKEYYEILDIRIIPRNEIFPKFHPLALGKYLDTSERLVIRLGKKYTIDKEKYFTCLINVYRYTTLRNIRKPKDNDRHNRLQPMPERIHIIIDKEEEQAEALQQGIYDLLLPANSIDLFFYQAEIHLASFRDEGINRLKEKEFTEDDIPEALFSRSMVREEVNREYSANESAMLRRVLDGPPPERDRAFITVIYECIAEQRKAWDIPKKDFVLLLTPKGNDYNKFSSFRAYPHADGFIQTSDWEYFTNTASWYPISYLILELLLKLKGFGSLRKSLAFQHKSPRGCINDQLDSKKDFHQKIRITDTCTDCLKVMMQNGLSASLLISISTIFDTIRKQSRFLNQHILTTAKSDLLITKEGILIFQDYESLSLRLPPIERTVYVFLLQRQNGLNSFDFTDYKQELTELYLRFRNQDTETAEAVITKLVDPRENSLQEKISKINKSIKSLLQSENRYTHYLIKNQDGKYVIALEPSCVHLDQGLI
jgi:hypothetical protein